MTTSQKNIFYFLLSFGMLGWGMSFVNIKIVSLYINEFETMFFRFAITAVTLIPIIILLKKSFRISVKSFLLILLCSGIFVAYMKYYFLGTKLGTVGLAGAFLMTLIPINTFIILAILKEKKMTKKESMALFIGAFGVLTMLKVWSFDMSEVLTSYNLYFVLASILWPLVTIISSKVTQVCALVFSFYLYLMTCVLNIILFVDLKKVNYIHFDAIFWINMLCLSLFASTFSYTIYFLSIEKLGASNVSAFLFLIPVFSIVLGIVFFNESLDFSIILGTILTIFAIKILNNITIIKRRS